MRIGRYTDGRDLTYDQSSNQFAVGGTSVTLEQVLQYDSFNQIEWSNDDTRTWARELQVSMGEGVQVAESRTGKLLGFRSRCSWKMKVAYIYYALCLISTVAVITSRSSYVADTRDSVLNVVVGILIALVVVSPALFLSDFGYRRKLPFFKRRKVLWSTVGFVVFFLFFSVAIGLANSLHSQSYKTAVEAERIAEQEREEAAREAQLVEEEQSVKEEQADPVETEAQTEFDAVRDTDEYQRLTSGEMTDGQARTFINAAEIAQVAYIGNVISHEKSDESGEVFLVESSDSGLSVIYGVVFEGDEVSEIRDEGLYVLYSDGMRNTEYIFWEDVGGPSQMKARVEAGIEVILKSPSSADFAGSFWDPYEGWGFDKWPGGIGVSGYVDSQNSFGAMIRSQFSVIFEVDTGENRGNPTMVYLNFDGEVICDER